MAKEKKFLSAVIYVHNDADQIEQFLTDIAKLLETNFEQSEIICVNDFSSDETVQKIKSVSEHIHTAALTLLNMSYFHGMEIAMNAGVDLSIGDFVLELDNINRDYALDEIMKAYEKVLEGNDIVSASPNRREKATSRIFYKVYRHFSPGNIQLHTESFRILSRRAINRVSGMSKTVPYRKALYTGSGLRTLNFKYETIENHAVSSGDERKYRNRLAVDVLLLFTDVGYFFSKMMSALMMFISIFMIVYTVVVYCMLKPVEGWTTMILFLSVAFFGVFVILTVIIKYLQILLKLTFKRTKYNFESIEKLTK